MLPAISGSAQQQMRQEGMDPNREMPIGTHHPQAVAASRAHLTQMEELKRSIESRFASVSTPSNFLQSGLFNTLGNNPVTQMISAAGGAVGDVWDQLLSVPGMGQDAKAKDPLAALNKHTDILKEIVSVLDSTYDLLVSMKQSGGGLGGGDGKISPRSGKHVKQDGTELKKPDGPRNAEDAEKQYQAAKNVRDAYKGRRETLSKEIEGEKDDGKKKAKLAQLQRLDADIARVEAKIKKREEVLAKAQEVYDKLDLEEGKVKPKTDPKKPESPEAPGFLSRAFKSMGKMPDLSKTLDQLKKSAGELSKTFGKTAKAAKEKGKPLADAIKGSETAKMLKLGKHAVKANVPKLAETAKGTVAKIVAGGTGFKAALGAVKDAEPEKIEPTFDPEKKLEGGKDSSLISDAISMAPEAVTAYTMLKGGAARAAGWLGGAANAAKSVASSGLNVLRSGGSKALEAASKAGGFLKGANLAGIAKATGVGHLALSGMSTAYDSLNTGTDEYANRFGAEAGESTLKDLGVRALGTMQDLGNAVTFGGADRLSNWISGNGFVRSDYYDKDKIQPERLTGAQAQPMPSRADSIQQMKGEIDKAKEAPAKSDATAVNVNNVSNNNTTIMPSRHDVRNTDVSFNRYLDRSLS
jgi:hypothetical protein